MSSTESHPSPNTPTASDLSARLDALPVNRKHRKVLVGSGIGWALDAMDVGLISFIVAALAVQWDLTKGETGLIVSIGFVGMALGASLGGLLADRMGRKQVFALTLLVYGLATGASALVGGLAALLILRFIVGLGLGAELPIASTYVSEFAPARVRGRLIVILEGFWTLGWTAAAIIGYFVVPASDNGWRWAFAIGAVPAVYALVVRWALPESPRWLASRGRLAEAEAIVADFEANSPESKNRPLPQPDQADDASTPIATTAGGRLTALWSPEFRVRTVALWTVWLCINFSYYGAFIWIPSILVDSGYSLVNSFGFTLIITLAQLPGYAVAAWLIEKWGRKLTLSVFLVGSAAAAVAFGTASSVAMVLGAGMALSFFNLGAWGALYAVTPEIYPTSLRGTGSGWAAGVGRIASIVAPLTVPLLLVAGGTGLTFTIFAGIFIIAAVAAWGLVDQRGTSLDER